MTVSLDGAADDDVSQANNESRAPAKPRGPFLSGSPQIDCAGFSVPRECFLEVHDGSYNRFPGKTYCVKVSRSCSALLSQLRLEVVITVRLIMAGDFFCNLLRKSLQTVLLNKLLVAWDLL